MTAYTRYGYTSPGSEKLFLATILVKTALAYDASNYWDIELAVLRSGEAYRFVLATFSTSTMNLPALEAVTLYDEPAGFALGDGDEVLVTSTSTGSPTLLANGKVRISKQRIAR